MASDYVVIPKCIFPPIPYHILIELRCDAITIHSNFIELAAVSADLDSAFMFFDGMLDEVELLHHHYDNAPDPKRLDIATELTEIYGRFFSEWHRSVGAGTQLLRNPENLQLVYIEKALPDRYLAVVVTKEK